MNCIKFPKSSESKKLANKYSFKEWMISRYLNFIPDIENFLITLNKKPTAYIRINTLKIEPLLLEQKLVNKNIESKQTISKYVLEVTNSNVPIGATQEYLSGYYYIQDLSSCLAVESLDVNENHLVLDMAASPGGKTTFLAQLMKNNGTIMAIEPNPIRLERLHLNLSRCGVINTCIMNISGSKIKDYNLKFDRILLDAPCSCDGIIQKDRKRKKTYSEDIIDYCSTNQAMLIKDAAKVIKPGGLLVYSTCSLAPEENELVVNSLFNDFDITLESIGFGADGLSKIGNMELNKSLKNSKRLYPHIHNTSGFYIAKIRVHGSKNNAS
ncbi:MAG: NOL1/NOP2/sun family putative RNA methylase [Nitrososphaeraceae archaeon]